MNKITKSGKKSLRRAAAPVVETLEGRAYMTAITAGFDGGNGTSSADQFAGVAGSGWVGPWHETNAASSFTTATVVNTSPLNSGGNYLSATLTASGGSARGAISRGYTGNGDVDPGATTETQMDFRVDSSLSTFTSSSDAVYIFGDSSERFAPGTADTALAEAFGASQTGLAAGHWGLKDGDGSGGGSWVDTGIALTQGTTYTVLFTLDAVNHQYTATITDGTAGAGHTYTSGTLGWDFNDSFTTSSHVYTEAGGRVSGTTETLSFSMDNVAITSAAASVPTAPSGLSLSTVSGSELDLSWTDNSSNETNFVIDRDTSSSFTSPTSTTVAAGTTAFSSTGLTAGTTYYYRVDAINGAGASAYTSTVSGTTPTLPADPTGLTITSVTSSALNVSWTDNATNETGYKLEWSTVSNFATIAGSSTLAANSTSGSATSLSADTTYYLRVSATNGAGSSGYATNSGLTALAAPSGLTATASSTILGNVALAWTDNSSTETGFVVQRSTDGFATFTTLTTTAANAVSYTDATALAGETYTYRVYATNTGDSNNSANVTSSSVSIATPTSSNTGTIAGSSLTAHGSYTVSASGTTLIQNEDISGKIVITAASGTVTIQNCIIDGGYTGGATGALWVIDAHTNPAVTVILENCEILNGRDSGINGLNNFTVRDCYIHDIGADGIDATDSSNAVIENSVISRIGYLNSASHADGIQLLGAATNITVRNTNFDFTHGDPNVSANSCMEISPKTMGGTAPSGVNIDHNWFIGDAGVMSYGLHLDGDSITVTDNVFTLGTFKSGCADAYRMDLTWNNNVDTSVPPVAVTPASV